MAPSHRVLEDEAVQLSGETVQTHAPVEVSQLSPPVVQVTPEQSATQCSVPGSHFLPAGQVFGETPHAHAPEADRQLSPTLQVTPSHLEMHFLVPESQRMVETAAVQLSEGELTHSHAPLPRLQLSPGAQPTPAHCETHFLAPTSHLLEGSTEVQLSGEVVQAQTPVAATQDSPGVLQLIPEHSPTQVRVAVSHFFPAGQVLGMPQWHSPLVGTHASPVGQLIPRHFSSQCRVEVLHFSVGAAAEQVSVGEAWHWHSPLVAAHDSPGAQLTPAHWAVHFFVAASQRVVATTAVQESGVEAHSQAPLAALQRSPATGQVTPSHMPTHFRVAASHFCPAGQVLGDSPQWHSPLVSRQASPAGHCTPVHLGSQRLVTGLHLSREPQTSHTQVPRRPSQRSPALQALPWQRSTQRRLASQTWPAAQLVSVQWHSPTTLSSQRSPAGQVAGQRFTQRSVEGSQPRPSAVQSAQWHTPVAGSQFSPRGQDVVHRVSQRLVASLQKRSEGQGEVPLPHSQRPVLGTQASPSAHTALAQRFSQRPSSLQTAGSGQVPSVQ